MPGVAVDRLANRGDRLVVVRFRIDADPDLARIDADHLIARDGAADVCADVAHAGDRAQLFAHARGDAMCLGVGRAGRRRPVHEQVAFVQRGQERLSQERPHGSRTRNHDGGCDERRARLRDQPFKKRPVTVARADRDRRLAERARPAAQQHEAQRRRDRQSHDHGRDDRQHVGQRERREEGRGYAAQEEDGQHRKHDDEGRVDRGTPRLQRRLIDHADQRRTACLALPPASRELFAVNNRVVDDDGQGDHEAGQDHRVERRARELENDHGGDERQRNRDDADERAAPVEEERAQHDGEQDHPDGHRERNVPDGALHVGGEAKDARVDLHPRQAARGARRAPARRRA